MTPPRTRTPLRAHAPTAATYTSGDISSAHGAAAERNANARYIAPARPRSGRPQISGPKIIVAAVTPRIALLYLSPNVSRSRDTAGLRACAASVSRAMRAGVESSALRMDRTTSAPSLLSAPAGISSPTRLVTGNASPVMCWMETSALPWTTTPSRGTCVDAARRDRWMDGWIDDVSARRRRIRIRIRRGREGKSSARRNREKSSTVVLRRGGWLPPMGKRLSYKDSVTGGVINPN